MLVEFKHEFKNGRQLFVNNDNTILLEFWEGHLAIYSIKNGITHRIMEDRNTFTQIKSPIYFSPDFRAYLAYECIQYKLNLNKVILWQIKGFDKPQRVQGVDLPPLDSIHR